MFRPNAASVLATAVLLLAAAALAASDALLAGRSAAGALQGLAVLRSLWARVTSGVRRVHLAASPTAGGLVTTGPSRYDRHPISAAVLLLVWAGVATYAAPQTLALAALGTAAVAMRIWAEARLVAARDPEYAAYASRTARVVPRVRWRQR